MVQLREDYEVEDLIKQIGMQRILEDMLEYLEELPGRQAYEAQLINDLTIAYNNYMSRYDDEDDSMD